ncbi:MAG: carbohydrate kinase [Gammaproteobacteria bacterium]|nr:carbohydrate kinase [Gammaproteobacteria bacterium]
MDRQDSTHQAKTSQTAIIKGSLIEGPVIFGEVLFDEFEDGSAILGGAPFNVAWHLQGFGLQPVFVTKVGNDITGNKVLETMRHWDMQTCGVQIDDEHPTGKVAIKLDQGQPTFDILPNQAYDNIDSVIDNNALFIANKTIVSETIASNTMPCPLLYHGTLALRNSTSRNTLYEIQKEHSLPTFVDINLRDPWWNEAVIQQSLSHATWAKLNDVELNQIAKLININKADQKETAIQVRKHFNIDLLIITLGANGAFFISKSEIHFGKPVPANNLVDTVGAGDAFSSVTILGLLKKWPIDVISQRAMAFASSVCEMRGATTTESDFYKKNLSLWGK